MTSLSAPPSIVIIGGGLAGCECALTLAASGVPCTLYEQKPAANSPAHESPLLAELVCSNSFKATRLISAAGLLKEEMRLLNSVVLAGAAAGLINLRIDPRLRLGGEA